MRAIAGRRLVRRSGRAETAMGAQGGTRGPSWQQEQSVYTSQRMIGGVGWAFKRTGRRGGSDLLAPDKAEAGHLLSEKGVTAILLALWAESLDHIS